MPGTAVSSPLEVLSVNSIDRECSRWRGPVLIRRLPVALVASVVLAVVIVIGLLARNTFKPGVPFPSFTNSTLPTFTNSIQLKESTWGKYFERVYGEIPESGYPIRLGDFWMFYEEALRDAGLPMPGVYGCPPNEFEAKKASYWYRSEWAPQIAVYHLVPWQPIPSNTWVEIFHRQRTMSSGSERHGAWFGYMKGSGMWTNMGRTIHFDTHGEAISYFGADSENDLALKAADLGFDTIQFLKGDGVSTDSCCEILNLGPCCHSLEFVSVKLQGTLGCCDTTGGMGFKAGWQHSRPCDCDENAGKFRAATGSWVTGLNCESVPPRHQKYPISLSLHPIVKSDST